MIVLEGAPDFGAPIAEGPSAMFEAHGTDPATPAAVVIPDRLAVAALPGGRPDFLVTLNRPAVPSDASPPWGALRMRLEPCCAYEDALATARAQRPGATLAIARAAGGFMRLVAAGRDVSLPADLAAPTPLDGAALDDLAVHLTGLSAESVGLLEEALQGGTLLVTARVELEVWGVAPRLASRASFSPRALLAPVVPPAPAPRRTTWAELVARLSSGLAAAAVALDPPLDGAEERALAEALADRLREEYGRLVPSPSGDAPTLEFPAEADLPDRVAWDLSRPVAARRGWALALDPLEAPRAMAARSGSLADLVLKRISPVLKTGVWDVFVTANLPPVREGLLAIGVTVRAPARPPARPLEVVRSLQLEPPGDQGSVQLQLSPKEPVAYLHAPYAVLAVGAGLRRVAAAEAPHEGLSLSLGLADFPVDFVPVSATPELLAQASVAGALAYAGPDGAPVTVSFALSPERPSTSLPLPRDATGPSIGIQASPTGPGDARQLGPLPARRLQLGPWSFPQYGPQRTVVEATFPPGADLVAVDLVPAGEADGAAPITTLHLTPDQPRREWTWFARSPFRSGYRWRPFVASGPPAPWSEVQPPARPLSIVAEPPARHAPPAVDLDGVHVYEDAAAPRVLRYVPAAPIPARAPDGSPLLALYQLGALGAVLQVSARFDLEDRERDRLRVDLSEQRLDLSAARFQPAPLTVDRVSVCLADPAGGAPAVLGTSSASGFPPWDAVFSVKLSPEQAERAALALKGKPGLLSVVVHATLPPQVAATFPDRPPSIERTADVATWVASPGPATPTP